MINHEIYEHMCLEMGYTSNYSRLYRKNDESWGFGVFFVYEHLFKPEVDMKNPTRAKKGFVWIIGFHPRNDKLYHHFPH